jgi:xanthine dehydrogenase YagS FAD-binding subunit
MNLFTYERASDLLTAAGMLAARPDARMIAGGTELLNWLKEGIDRPAHLVDINDLPLASILVETDVVRIGALARLSDVAAHPGVREACPAVAEALELSASPQLRNMASMGGNLLQRTRCPYFRADAELPCNKRRPGTGCAAIEGENRTHAIFGWSTDCVATHPSDVAVALAAFDAVVQVTGPGGERRIPLLEFYAPPGRTPQLETALLPGEIITAIDVPRALSIRRSRYLKVRERASYEFALVSAAAGIEADGATIVSARLALGGVAHKPWRLQRAERALEGRPMGREAIRAALDLEFRDARPLAHNGFKVELAARAAMRALEAAWEIPGEPAREAGR